MATITGHIGPPVDFPMPDGTPVNATLEVALCGYGSQVPRVPGLTVFGRLTEQNITVDDTGNFQFSVNGNDEIVPAGTYYTVTIRNGNGDIAQVNAYQFLESITYDLSIAQPYDPNQPPPPLPPIITNQLQIVPWSEDPLFDGSTVTAWQITLSGTTDGAHLANLFPGNLYTFIIQQDDIGNHLFYWPYSDSPTGPGRVFNGAAINMEPNSITIQTFVCDAAQNLYSIAGGSYYP
jgi:hypothetical protein